MRIELSGCVVRSLEESDADSIALHANDREVWINLRDGFPHPYSRTDADEFIRRNRGREPETIFAIEVDGKAAGAIGFHVGSDVERTGAEVGYWLGRPFWGRGIMTEALVAVRDHAMANFPLTRMYGVPYEWNEASFRVLDKAGFGFEGRLRQSAIKDGRVIDQLMYAYVVREGES